LFMGILISCQTIGKSYSSRPLFRGITFGIEEGERLGLIGPNGAGKSTLMKVIAGMVEPDEGSVVRRKKLRVAYVDQKPDLPSDDTIYNVIANAAVRDGTFQDYEIGAHIDGVFNALAFPDREALVSTLSGGWKKRLAIGCAVVKQPELLLMDEPTNHLDLEGILWLEKFLKSAKFAYVVVSHDRVFLEAVTNRIVELNPTYPQGFLSVQGNYSVFLLNREQALNAQAHLQQTLASKVRREVAWLQRGARARQTKARGRIQDAEKLIDQLAEVKARNAMTNSIEIGFDASGRKTKELVVLKGVKKSLGGRKLIDNVSATLSSGIRLGLVGKNGSGKTTLLKMIVGTLAADDGTVKRAQDLQIVWFDQNREQLDTSKSLKDCLCPHGDSVIYRGCSLHVMTWAKRFLFRADQLNMPISYLSGGEQARILIANLMLKSADILILDEPTNDLDIPSLEVLEDSLLDFPGAVILVTHDRMMLHSVANSILAIDGNGGWETFADYEQCEEKLDRFVPLMHSSTKSEAPAAAKEKKPRDRSASGLMSTAEKRELAGLPEKIEHVENELKKLQKEMESPIVAANYTRLQELDEKQRSKHEELEGLFARWELLEAKAASMGNV
jgi:ATP-binding cassette subfamily F protein uup